MEQENTQRPSPLVHNTKVIDIIYLCNSYFSKLQQLTNTSLSRYNNIFKWGKENVLFSFGIITVHCLWYNPINIEFTGIFVAWN